MQLLICDRIICQVTIEEDERRNLILSNSFYFTKNGTQIISGGREDGTGVPTGLQNQ